LKILEYIDSVVTDTDQEVLEIGSWHGELSNWLHSKGIKITATECIPTAPIWETTRSYPVKLLDYEKAMNLKHWDLIIANNVIHHLHSPYHFWDVMVASCDRLIVSGCISNSNIRHIVEKDPESDFGVHSRIIRLSTEHHISYLKEFGWTINEYHTNFFDTLGRNSWLINASR
jgi:2-polyprenyl-3-methyl-5-hydroxy-6-metoxy-1,4-benzoquinol methylase